MKTTILIDTSVWVRFFIGSEEAKFVAAKIRENAALLCSVREAGVPLATFDRTLRSCAVDIGIPCIPER